MEAELAGVELRWAALSDVGRVRKLNEDSMVAEPPVFVVADGMGGHDAGEVASALATNRFESLATSEPLEVDQVSAEVHHAHALIQDATIDGKSVHMGTTAVGVFLVDCDGRPNWLIMNVGDSRSYLFADDRLEQITRDHSYVQELVDTGQISEDEARVHPERNVITQALGLADELQPDFWIRPVRVGERFMICSDGLTGEVEDAEIESVLRSERDPNLAVAALVAAALEHGGRDNVSVILLEVVGVKEEHGTTTETGKAARSKPVDSVAISAGPLLGALRAPSLTRLKHLEEVAPVPVAFRVEEAQSKSGLSAKTSDMGEVIAVVPVIEGHEGEEVVDETASGDEKSAELIKIAPLGLAVDDEPQASVGTAEGHAALPLIEHAPGEVR